jgi:hypothetical protein
MLERKDFKTWQVEARYRFQDGVCATKGCGRSLEHGFARHHENGDPSDNSIENLRLLCPRCHFATFTGDKKAQYERHKKQEARVLELVNKLLDEQFVDTKPKFSGAEMERMNDLFTESLKISRRLAELDGEIENVPSNIRFAQYWKREKELEEIFLEGYKSGISLGLQEGVRSVNNLNREKTKK